MKLIRPAGANGRASPAPQASASSVNKGIDWFKSNLTNILLGIIGLVVIGFGLYGSSFKTPGPADVVSWSRQHWLWILVLWGILAALVAVNAKGSVAKTLQWVLAGVMFFLFLGFPLLGWLGVGDDKGSPPPAGSAPQQDAVKRSSRLLPQNTPGITWAWETAEWQWPRVRVQPYDNSVRIPNLDGNGHTVWGGDGFTIHYVYADGRECTFVAGTGKTNPCDGGAVESYAHNDGSTAIYASYAYARQGEK
jgi:hypothetical protein